MLRVPEHYTNFSSHPASGAWLRTDALDAVGSQSSGPSDWLKTVRKVVFWGVLGAPAMLVMAVWQFVDPVDPNYGQEQRD